MKYTRDGIVYRGFRAVTCLGGPVTVDNLAVVWDAGELELWEIASSEDSRIRDELLRFYHEGYGGGGPIPNITFYRKV